jgi:uncharacterized delta-60 repeat protein
MTRAICIAMMLGQAVLNHAQQPFQLDPTFRTNIQKINVRGVVPLEDGRVIVSGQLYFGQSDTMFGGARLHPNGARDLSFAPVPNMGGKLVRWQNKIYSGVGNIVRRVDLDGYNDPSFIMMNNDPLFSSLQGADYHVFPDGRLLVCGLHNLYDYARGFVGYYSLIWFDATGHVDTTRHHRYSSGTIWEIEEQPDGRFLCTMTASTFEGQPVGRVFRVHADGALDTSFNCPITWGKANRMTTLDDGRILVSGLFGAPSLSWDSLHFVRLMPDGSIDPTFNNFLQVTDPLHGQFTALLHTRLSDGRIAAHGNFSHIEGQPRQGIALLDADGNLIDDAFAGPGCGAFTYPAGNGFTYRGTEGMVQGPDSMWYIYGAYHGYNDGTVNDPLQRQVSRLHPADFTTGAQDATAVGNRLALHPNPARSWVAVDHSFPHAPTQATIRVRDAVGKAVLMHPVNGIRGQTVLSSGNLPPGMYSIELLDQGMTMDVKRLIVQ